MTTDSPELVDVIRTAIAGALGAMRVIGIGSVDFYDPKRQSATVRSAVKFCYYDDNAERIVQYQPMPIPNIPVLHPSAGGFFSAMPVKEGDQGVILTADRAIDAWKSTGGVSNDTIDGRRFDFADSLFLPVGASFADSIEAVDKNNEKWIWGEQTPNGFRFELGDGKFEFGTPVVRFLKQVTDGLGATQLAHQHTAASTTVTLLGPQPLLFASSIAAQVMKLAQIEALINTIRGT